MVRALLEQATQDCVKASLVADQHAHYLKRRDAIVIPTESDDNRDLVSKVKTMISEANLKAKDKKYEEATTQLFAIEERCAQIKVFEAKYDDAKTSHGTLSGGDATLLNEAMSAAKELAKRDEFGAAFTRLDQATSAGDAKAAKSKLTAGNEVDDETLNRLMATKEGRKQLDDVVVALPDTVQRQVLIKIMEKRFGLSELELRASSEGGGATEPVPSGTVASPHTVEGSGKSLKKIYQLMSQVPESHTMNNPSLDKITQVYGSYEGYSYYDSGDVVLRCGRVDGPSGGNDYEVGLDEIDTVECQPVADDVVPPATYFDWQTLHETGHAVDDRKNYMTKNGSGPDYGKWEDHGANVLPVADAAATHFFAGDKRDVDAQYATKLLSGQQGATAPSPPSGAVDWSTKLADLEEWCEAVKTNKELWESSADCAKYKISVSGTDRVFHEAYPGTWVSYNYDARKQGVSGYQFRAPGEWFSELYAAFESKKLKAGHPAVSWLKVLLKEPNYPN